MKSLLKLVAIVALVGVLAGCRKTEEMAKEPTDAVAETPVAVPEMRKTANIVYNGVTIGENTMPEGAREKADLIAADAAKLTVEETEK
ncbi:MAG: hypothetical protein PHS31_00160 [Victivallaceae bacterium]|nr:hypothetical protein [Victivallaceae bacterium]MDD4180946.1 hypothetical protein [Victivallaceae bacterium]